MNRSALSRFVMPLRELLKQYADLIAGCRGRTGSIIIGLTCDCVPPEVTAALDVTALRLPSFVGGACTCESAAAGVARGVYDLIVVPKGCASAAGLACSGIPIHELDLPHGWGESAALRLREAVDGLLRAAGRGGIDCVDQTRLRECTIRYNALRRLVRGVAGVRRAKPASLSCQDLAVIHEAAMVLPPDTVEPYLADLLDAMNREPESGEVRVPALVYQSFINDSILWDGIEEAGCVIVEDDSCGGRRQFEMSYSADNPRLLEEIFDAYSYRPLCPSVRPLGERVELFYRMVKSQGIELVVFVEDQCCPARKRDIGILRDVLMRSGVDPIVVTAENAAAEVREYVRRCG